MSKSKVVLVTGANSGFGRLIVQSLARGGHQVVGGMRDPNGKGAKAKAELTAMAQTEKLTLHTTQLDVTDDASVNKAVGGVVEQFGRIDVLVNNAGSAVFGLTEAFTPEQFQKLFDTNVVGVMRMNRAVLPHMRNAKQGLLVHIGSGIGRHAMPFMGPYCASKFALEAISENLRYELSPFGVDSVIVEPGGYPSTNIMANMMMPADGARIGSYGEVAKMMQQMGEGMAKMPARDPQEVADAVVKLVGMAQGERPTRTLVGDNHPALQGLNDAFDKLSAELLGMLGLGTLRGTFPAVKS